MTYGALMAALLERYPKREYAVLSEVRDATGWSGKGRTADLLALSLWPSRGLVLHGFEIKSYRGDWKREQGAPEKADAIAQFCDYWWLALTDAKIARLDEVPATWGVLAPDDKGKLAVVKQADRMQPQPWTRGFMASMFRKLSDAMVPMPVVAARVDAGYQDGLKAGLRQGQDANELARLRRVEENLKKFEAASGLSIAANWEHIDMAHLGVATKLLLKGEVELKWKLAAFDRATDAAVEVAKVLRQQRKTLEDAVAKCVADPEAEVG